MGKPTCHKCGNVQQVYVRRIINASGESMYAWRCIGCNVWAENPPKWIKHDEMQRLAVKAGKPLDDVPIIEDYRQPCVVCGHPGAQYNHWMPQVLKKHPAVAPQWAKWDSLGAPLCQFHHDLWHDLVTPWMPGRGNSRHER